jgi:Ca2+-transporting ATPase
MTSPTNHAGLTSAEAARRLLDEGPNELPGAQGRSILTIVLETILEPIFLLLALSAGLYLALGDRLDALTLMSVLLLMCGITVVQAERTERVLGSLREMTSPRASVLRDGVARRVPGREVVRGDLLLLAEGDRIAADAALLAGGGVLADESLLTGESAPVRKQTWDGAQVLRAPGGDDLPFLFAGTVLVKGQGMARALATRPPWLWRADTSARPPRSCPAAG